MQFATICCLVDVFSNRVVTLSDVRYHCLWYPCCLKVLFTSGAASVLLHVFYIHSKISCPHSVAPTWTRSSCILFISEQSFMLPQTDYETALNSSSPCIAWLTLSLCVFVGNLCQAETVCRRCQSHGHQARHARWLLVAGCYCLAGWGWGDPEDSDPSWSGLWLQVYALLEVRLVLVVQMCTAQGDPWYLIALCHSLTHVYVVCHSVGCAAEEER